MCIYIFLYFSIELGMHLSKLHRHHGHHHHQRSRHCHCHCHHIISIACRTLIYFSTHTRTVHRILLGVVMQQQLYFTLSPSLFFVYIENTYALTYMSYFGALHPTYLVSNALMNRKIASRTVEHEGRVKNKPKNERKIFHFFLFISFVKYTTHILVAQCAIRLGCLCGISNAPCSCVRACLCT